MPGPDVPPPIDQSVLRVDDDGITLLGGWSPSSGYRHFPPSPVCPFTGADDIEPVDLPRSGTVWLHTSVNLPPPGYRGTVPYGFGIVELDGEPLLRIISRLGGDGLAPGTRVRLTGEELPGPEGEPVLTWSFIS
ncbi:MAG TPA: OB-fold domain-containing protein [Acidimicrobiales bacterium]